MKAVWGLLFILALNGTAGHAACDWGRVLGRAPKPANAEDAPTQLNHVRLEFKALGVKTLEKALTSARVVFQPKTFRFQHDVTWKIRGGEKILVVRELPWTTEEQRQRSTWNVARALYQIQLDRNLLSDSRALWNGMKQPLEWQSEDELMGLLLVQWPLEARAAKKARIDSFKADLKLLASKLTLLKNLPRGNWDRYFRKALSFLFLTVAFTAVDYSWSQLQPPTTISQSEDRTLRWHNDLVEKYLTLDPSSQEANGILEEIRDLESYFEFEPCQSTPTDKVGTACGVKF